MGCSSSTNVVARVHQHDAKFFDKYELANVLGRGAYGTVHVAHSVESTGDFAVKILDLRGGKKTPTQLRENARSEEMALAATGGHPNVIGLQEAFSEENFAYFVMELCVGPLRAAWVAEPDLNEYVYVRYFRQMAQGLAHIHSVGVVHRDVKQDNFLVGAPDGRTVKLCDFGLSALIVGDGRLTDQVGTPAYMAPEMVTEPCIHGPKVDVWSLGVIVYTAFYGCWPYQPSNFTKPEIKRAIREDIFSPNFAPRRRCLRNVVSGVGTRLVKALLNRDPLTRPTADSCLQLRYLNRVYSEQLPARGPNASRISLAPHLRSAVDCLVFDMKTPEVDVRQQQHLMTLQRTAQLVRESCLLGREEPRSSQAALADVVGTGPLPSQPGLFDTQEHEGPISTEQVKLTTAIEKTSTSDALTDNTEEIIADRPV